MAKLTEIKDLASFIPLFLEGDALALYLEMSDEDQLKADKIKSRLKEAFAQGTFDAYGRLKRVKWLGEQVDVFANEIRRLAGLAGWTGEGLERAVKLAFVTGFPDHISMELQHIKDVDSASMHDLLARARILVTGGGKDVTAVATEGTVGRHVYGQVLCPQRIQPSNGREVSLPLVRGFKGRCF